VANRRKRSLTGLDQRQAWATIAREAAMANHWLVIVMRCGRAAPVALLGDFNVLPFLAYRRFSVMFSDARQG
jgi:hypothetical protein